MCGSTYSQPNTIDFHSFVGMHPQEFRSAGITLTHIIKSYGWLGFEVSSVRDRLVGVSPR